MSRNPSTFVTGATSPGEQDLFPFATLAERGRPAWPPGVRVVLMVVLHFEAMDFDAPAGIVSDPRWRERVWPDPRLQSFVEYGNRVALFRILDTLDRLKLKVTVAADALASERYPHLVEQFRKRGYEIAARGLAVNRMLSATMPEDEERRTIAETIARIAQATGTTVRGWIGQDFGESPRTPRLLADAGIAWLADWPNDDEPYPMAGAGGIVSLPVAYEWDDMRLFIERRMQAWHYPPMLRDAFATLFAEGVNRPRVLPVSIHPWVFGAPHRFRYLDETLALLATREGVWNATASDIASCSTA